MLIPKWVIYTEPYKAQRPWHKGGGAEKMLELEDGQEFYETLLLGMRAWHGHCIHELTTVSKLPAQDQPVNDFGVDGRRLINPIPD